MRLVSDSVQNLTFARLIAAPRYAVWRAFEDPDAFANWWGAPYPARTVVHEHGFRPGGGFRHALRMPDGSARNRRGRFIQLAECERAVFADSCLPVLTGQGEGSCTLVADLLQVPEGTFFALRLLPEDDRLDLLERHEWGEAVDLSANLERLARIAAQLS